jgi:hypothetical protein
MTLDDDGDCAEGALELSDLAAFAYVSCVKRLSNKTGLNQMLEVMDVFSKHTVRTPEELASALRCAACTNHLACRSGADGTSVRQVRLDGALDGALEKVRADGRARSS